MATRTPEELVQAWRDEAKQSEAYYCNPIAAEHAWTLSQVSARHADELEAALAARPEED